jgi:putative tricarboxylic transport membrane protein
MKVFYRFFVTIVLTFTALGSAALAAAGPYPEKPIEFVTHSAPGGGSDVFARRMGDMIAKEKILPVPLVVVNKSGGAGAIAIAYVATKKGDPYTILATTTTIYATMARGEVKVSLDDFTPICALIQDPNILVVRANAPYRNVKEFIDAAKKKRKTLNQGMGSIGSTDHILARRVEKATGVEFNIISFKQTMEANTALLGGHIDFSIGNPSELSGQIEAGTLRAIATVTDKRLPSLPNVPTLKEAGVDVSFAQIRGIWGTKNMPKDVVQYLETAFSKVTKTEPWKKYLEGEMVLDAYMGTADYKKWVERGMIAFTQDMNDLGLVKKK